MKPSQSPSATVSSSSISASPSTQTYVSADDGARIVQVDALDPRTLDLTIDSPAVGNVIVRLLIPASYHAEPTSQWPLLYLLTGTGGSHEDWTVFSDVEVLTTPTNLLVVMPDAGDAGWYSDWYNAGSGGPPMWETFHLTELIQLLERNFRASDKRSIAGLSMGGFGALVYAARHPGMFKAIASYSGVVDLSHLFFDQDPAVWGSRTENLDVWNAHDPYELIESYRGVPLYVAFGDGSPGPLDDPGETYDFREGSIEANHPRFVSRLAELGIPATVNAYGPGTHSTPYWERDLHESLPMLMAALPEATGSSSRLAPPAVLDPTTGNLSDAGSIVASCQVPETVRLADGRALLFEGEVNRPKASSREGDRHDRSHNR